MLKTTETAVKISSSILVQSMKYVMPPIPRSKMDHKTLQPSLGMQVNLNDLDARTIYQALWQHYSLNRLQVAHVMTHQTDVQALWIERSRPTL
ncbi:hypothetical protein AVEN_188972-1 [Araneus ventricosus]|uniref:Uncharacterized protein n=1 Tax=Araneus ventricosus TaxID=182803 RepID=A0A4Y2TTT0_ARAVE|nr:hypothetical protein AVEN_188972-1 [Araneus ventricosus]